MVKKQQLILLSSVILIAVIFSILITQGRKKPSDGSVKSGSLEEAKKLQENAPALQPLDAPQPQEPGKPVKNNTRRRTKKDNEISMPQEGDLPPLEISPSEEEQKEAESLGIKLSEEEMRTLEKKNIMLY